MKISDLEITTTENLLMHYSGNRDLFFVFDDYIWMAHNIGWGDVELIKYKNMEEAIGPEWEEYCYRLEDEHENQVIKQMPQIKTVWCQQL